MLSEDRIVLDSNDIVDILWIIVSQVCQDIQLHPSLMMESLLIPDDLYSDMFVGFVVEALDGLPETSLAQKLLNLIPVAQMVFHDNLVVTTVIIVAVVEFCIVFAMDFSGVQSKEVDFLEILDFMLLILCEMCWK